MTIQPGAVLYTQGLGSRPEGVEVPHVDVRSPTIYDIKFPVGKKWIDQVGQGTYTLVDFISTSNVVQAVWVAEGGANAGLTSIVTQAGTATVANSQITINGDAAGNTHTSASGATITVSLDNNPAVTSLQAVYLNTDVGALNALMLHNNTISGEGTATNTDVIVTPKGTGNLVLTSGNLDLQGASSKLLINAGTAASASIGSVTLVAGTATVSTTAVTANSIIFLTVASLGTVTAPQAMYISAITAGVSFAITSADATDTSVVNYLIIN